MPWVCRACGGEPCVFSTAGDELGIGEKPKVCPIDPEYECKWIWVSELEIREVRLAGGRIELKMR